MKQLTEYSADLVFLSMVALFVGLVFFWWGVDPGTAGRILIAAYSLLSAVYMVIWDRYDSKRGEK